MIATALKHHYYAVRKLKELSAEQKEYKILFKRLRLIISPSVIFDFKISKKGDTVYPYKIRYYSRLISCIFFGLLSVILAILMLFFGGNDEVQEFTLEETRAFVLWTIAVFIPMLVGLILAYQARHIIDEYIKEAIQNFSVNLDGITSDELDKILELSANNDEFEENQICGCFHCGKILQAGQLKHDNRQVFCPYCEASDIVFQSVEYPLTEDLLKKMKQFWYD